MKSNPAWADKALTRALPRFTEEDLALPLSVKHGRGLHFEPLGCGHYGCVLATTNPNIVFKLTSDPSEARLVSWILSHSRQQNGLVKYYKLSELDTTFRGRTLFAIWREAAYDVGIYGRARTVADPYDARMIRQFENRLSQFKTLASRVKAILDKTGDPVAYMAKTKEYDGSDYVDFEGDNIVVRIPERSTFPKQISIRLAGCEAVAQMMANEPEGYLVGQALENFLDDWVLLADVHLGNIGRVDRPDHAGALVITDPGHAVFMRAS